MGGIRTAEFEAAGAVPPWEMYQAKLASRSRLAEIDPTNHQWFLDSAELLELLAAEYRKAGMTIHFVGAREQSCTILRELAHRNQRNVALQRKLARSLNRLASARIEGGSREQALGTLEECLVINRRLSKRDGSTAQLLATAENLEKLSDLALELSHEERALPVHEELLSVERKLVETDPTNKRLQWNLALTLDRLGDLRGSANDSPGALLAYEQCISIRRRWAEAEWSDTCWAEELCWTLKKLGDARSENGEADAAFAAYAESVFLARGLSTSRPDEGWQATLALLLQELGSSSIACGYPERGLDLLYESFAIHRSLAESADLNYLRGLCSSLDAIAHLAQDKTHQPKALDLWECCLRTRRQPALADTDGPDCRTKLLRTLNVVGDLRHAAGDAAGALAAYTEVLSFHRQEAAANAWNCDLQRAIWADLKKITEARLSIGDYAGALAASEEGLGIARQVLQVEQSNAEFVALTGDIENATIGQVVQRLAKSEELLKQLKLEFEGTLEQACRVRLQNGDGSGAFTAFQEMVERELKPCFLGHQFPAHSCNPSEKSGREDEGKKSATESQAVPSQKDSTAQIEGVAKATATRIDSRLDPDQVEVPFLPD